MKNARLQLEFAPRSRRASTRGLALLLVSALLFAASVAEVGRALAGNARQARTVAEMEGQGNASAPVTPRASRLEPAELSRVQLVRQTARSLMTPWLDLLEALESAPANVALLSVEPSAAKRSIALTAEAANAADMLEYLRALQGDKRLSGVTLVSHQVQAQAPGSPLRFQIQATWGVAS
jgi:Tfp pilus assembly protein PilN